MPGIPFYICAMKILTVAFFTILCACNDNITQKNTEAATASENDLAYKPTAEILFKANCASCHKCEQDYTGPALHGAGSRWQNKDLLYAFVRNSQEVIAKDAYAKSLFKKWNGTVMTPFNDLTNEQINDILQYCDTPVK